MPNNLPRNLKLRIAGDSPIMAQMRADMLEPRHFTLAMVAAVALHFLGLYVWFLIPKQQVIDVPVRALNIKLGDGDENAPDDTAALEFSSGNASAVETTLSHMVRDESRSNSVVSSMDKAMNAVKRSAAPGALDQAIKAKATATAEKISNIARQFVREMPLSKTAGDKNGNSPDAEMISRYEQLISLWVKKFLIYPEEARAEGIVGDTVVRVRIDRRGSIRYYALERSTGYPELDRAAIDMIRRANPVPAVPNNYPQGDLLEFLIPVSFKVQ